VNEDQLFVLTKPLGRDCECVKHCGLDPVALGLVLLRMLDLEIGPFVEDRDVYKLRLGGLLECLQQDQNGRDLTAIMMLWRTSSIFLWMSLDGTWCSASLKTVPCAVMNEVNSLLFLCCL
jgi:hypothetical protein